MHPKARTAALAACAAQQQGKFWEMEDAIWKNAWPNDRLDDTKLEEASLTQLAVGLGLKPERFALDLASDRCRDDVDNDQQLLKSLGMSGTPSFFINGRYLSGAQPIERFRALVDEEMLKADAAIKKGTRATRYYESIVKSGKKAP